MSINVNNTYGTVRDLGRFYVMFELTVFDEEKNLESPVTVV